jgi:hypothetical protein
MAVISPECHDGGVPHYSDETHQDSELGCSNLLFPDVPGFRVRMI